MARTSVWPSLVLIVLALAGAGCTEKLTTPGTCPVCPPTGLQMADTLLTGVVTADTTARGYVGMNEATYVAASTLDSLKSIALYRFSPLDTFWVQGTDTVKAASPPDSVQVVLPFVFRDTTAHARLVLYRLPAKFDTAMTYAQATAALADSVLLDTAAVPDTGVIKVTLPVSVAPKPGDSGVVAIGIKVTAASPTVVALTSGHSGSTPPTLTFFVHGRAPKDTLKRNLGVAPTFAGFTQTPVAGPPPPGLLALGGLPSAHTILHFTLPKVALDSAGIVRGTLYLTIARPAVSYPRDSFVVEAFALLRDYGPKSVIYPDTLFSGHSYVHDGQTGTVALDIGRILRLWGTTLGDTLPKAIALSVLSEGTELADLFFVGRSGGAAAPRLRVTYVKQFEAGVP